MLVDKFDGNGVLVEDGGCLETRGVKVTEPTRKKRRNKGKRMALKSQKEGKK